jgi:bifunctional non-homologous end joining protein LigD
MLQDLLEGHDGAIRLSETIEADGDELLKHACKLGLEGIIAKHEDRPYRSGRTGDWLKVKCIQSDSFVVVGYEPSTAVPGAIASLLLAAKRKGGLIYVGGVGTGFKRTQAIALRRQLDAIRTTKPVVSTKGRNLVWVEPKLVAEIDYRGWSDDLSLRHASFKGLRDIEDTGEIFSINSLPLDR